MSDCGNICIVQHGGTAGGAVYVHSEWGGSRLPVTLQRALVRARQQWDNELNLARVVLAELTRGDEDALTGIGISTYLAENHHPVLVVDCQAQTVGLAEPRQIPRTFASWPFETYVGLDLSRGLADYEEDLDAELDDEDDETTLSLLGQGRSAPRKER